MRLERKKDFYEKYIKRFLDILCSSVIIIVFGWLYVVVAILVRINLGKPVLFKQPRPGMVDSSTGREKIFDMYKFRTMSDERGQNGELLPDKKRLGVFGRILRATSLDELPEVFNILMGDMSLVGPRPQLVRDMTFMSDEQRMRHTAKPGLTGLAQVMGRNALTWEEKIDWDLKYIEKISFWKDLSILFMTVVSVFKREGITDGENATALDYGDVLLRDGKVSRDVYDGLQLKAKEIVRTRNK